MSRIVVPLQQQRELSLEQPPGMLSFSGGANHATDRAQALHFEVYWDEQQSYVSLSV